MVKPQKVGCKTRMSFAKIDEVLEMPDLIEVQKKSYQWFLREGLREVLRDVSPITDYSGNLQIEFVDYSIDPEPKYPVEECKERDVNYAAPLRVTVRLFNKLTGEVMEREIFMGDFPLMTENGTFVINGAERVIVSQIVRSPGINYSSEMDKTGKRIFKSQVIPYRGAWLEGETDANNVFYIRVDKNRKFPITIFIRALGLGTDAEIKEMFGEDPLVLATLEKDTMPAEADKNNSSAHDEALKEIYKKLRPGEPPLVESAELLLHNYFFDPKRYDLANVGRYKFNKKLGIARRIEGHTAARDIVSPITGEVLVNAGDVITEAQADAAEFNAVNEVCLQGEGDFEIRVFSNNTVYPEAFLGFDLTEAGISGKVCKGALDEIIASCGKDHDAVIAAAREHMADLYPKHITKDDIYSSINYLIHLTHGVGTEDDIDHLGNRRLRSVGELLQNQLRTGFARMDKIVKERMTIQDTENQTPDNLINIRPIVTAVREFFGSSPLSQFMDQNNPLAELTHKRRLSALGPGGLSRERASFDVRDVHYSHYGRMCPIETPEGPNIGLINYLASYAQINEYGFVEAPYRKVERIYDENGKYVGSRVTDEVEYMSADVEDDYHIAQAKEPVDENGMLLNERITCRHRDEIIAVDREVIDYIDVSPKMMTSIATAFIPFLQNDDANRALMGANMQRQAVPLMVTEAPIVATGVEQKCAVDSEVCIKAEGDGVVTRVSADGVSVRYDDGSVRDYTLTKFARSNQGTCVNQRPIVTVGERVEAGQVIADGPACSQGEIALGKNVLIGFMTWEGYNYEDAVLLSEELVRNDVFTSIHLEKYECEARDTKLGAEEITRDLPNVGDDALRDLDAEGIIRVHLMAG
mgnify:CR=1 FL=1